MVEGADTRKTRREAALLLFAVFVLGLVVGGIANHLWGGRVWGRRNAVPQRTPQRERILNALTRELQLTPDQQRKIGAIVDETMSQFRALHSQQEQQGEKIREQARTRIQAVLTPEQVPKFEQFMEHIEERRKRKEGQR